MRVKNSEMDHWKSKIRLKSNRNFSKFLAGFFAMFFGLLTLIPIMSFSSGSASAEPFGVFCGNKDQPAGLGMTPSNKFSSWFMVEPDATGRKWTLQEAFGNSITFVNYHGEGDAQGQVGIQGVGEERIPNGFDKIKTRVENQRTIETCVKDFSTFFVNFGLAIPKLITSFSGVIAGFAFNPSFICTQSGPSCHGIDLVGVIGGDGTGGNGGIIGALTSSIYTPLSIILAAIVGVWLLKTGIIDRKYREAFQGLGWFLASFIIGLTFLLNPSIVARLPMQISSGLAGCVIGAFNGDNCMSGSSGASINVQSDTNQVCSSYASGSNADMSFVVNSLSCDIWKAFVLEPYSLGSFGMSYEDLDTKNGSESVKNAITAAGLSSDDFCVNLVSSKSATAMNLGKLELDGSSKRECNLVAYQLYLQTYAYSSGDKLNGGDAQPAAINSYDPRWNKIITTVAQDEGMWIAWTKNNPGDMVMVSSISSVAGSSLIIFVSILALIYYIGGTVLIGFAPIFLLFGLQPARGKKIMLGWLEKIVSNILKYVVSALFLIVGITLLGSVLGSVKNPWLALILIIILVVALFMYRKELMDLLGRANMGGEQLKTKLSDSKFMKKTKQIGAGVIGGAIGSKLAGGTIESGARAALKRDLKRGTGIGAQVARQYDRTGNYNLQAAREDKRDFDSKAENEANMYRESEARRDEAVRKESEAQDLVRQSSENYDSSKNVLNSVEGDRRSGISDLSRNYVDPSGAIPQTAGPLMGEMLRIIDKMKDLNSTKNNLVASGVPSNDPRMIEIDKQLSDFGGQKTEVSNELRALTNSEGKAVLAKKSDAQLANLAEQTFNKTESGQEILSKLEGKTYGDAHQDALDAAKQTYSANKILTDAQEAVRVTTLEAEKQAAIAKGAQNAAEELQKLIDESTSTNKTLHSGKLKETVDKAEKIIKSSENSVSDLNDDKAQGEREREALRDKIYSDSNVREQTSKPRRSADPTPPETPSEQTVPEEGIPRMNRLPEGNGGIPKPTRPTRPNTDWNIDD